MRIVCNLDEIMKELGLTGEAFAHQIGIGWRTLRKIRDGDDGPVWALRRDQLYRLMIFAADRGRPLFEIKPNPLWEPFKKTTVHILRGDRETDALAEQRLAGFFKKIESTTKATIARRPADIERMMKSYNCVIIGSPKANVASEVAFALLWDAKPFDSSEENRLRIPIHFLGMNPENGRGSALLVDSAVHAVDIQTSPEKERARIPVSWVPPEEYDDYEGLGQDAATLVVCRNPLKTKNPVTTVVIAGYTGLATLAAVKEATQSEIPDLDPLEPGRPKFSALKFVYTKSKRVGTEDQRVPKDGSQQWGPPWPRLFTD